MVVGALRERAGPCLASLAGEAAGVRLEVLLVDLASPGAPPVPGSDLPVVVRLPLPPGTRYAEARAEAVSRARGRVVAFLEEHTRVRPGWARAVVDAFAGPFAGVGAAVAWANPDGGRRDVVGLLSYGNFLPPLPPGETKLLPGHNASFRTDVLRGYGDELRHLLACDLAFHVRLRRDGQRFAIADGAVIEHLNESTVGTIGRGVHLFYRLYGPLRAAEDGWGPARRALYVLATPVIPLYFLVGLLTRLRRGHRELVPLVVRHAPFILAVQLLGAVGQALGLVLGPGDAEEAMTRYELTAERTFPRAR